MFIYSSMMSEKLQLAKHKKDKTYVNQLCGFIIITGTIIQFLHTNEMKIIIQ